MTQDGNLIKSKSQVKILGIKFNVANDMYQQETYKTNIRNESEIRKLKEARISNKNYLPYMNRDQCPLSNHPLLLPLPSPILEPLQPPTPVLHPPSPPLY